MKLQNQITVAVILVLTALASTLVYDYKNGSGKMLLGLDLRSGSHITIRLVGENDAGEPLTITPEIQQQSIQVFRKRLDPDGNQEIVITPEENDRLLIEIPEVTDLAEAESRVRRAGRLEFRESAYNPATRELVWTTRMDGSAIARASAELDPNAARESWMISFSLTSGGTREFANLTRELVGKPLGIFFDGEEISAPNVNSPITGGQGVITGSFTKDEALELANYLNAGALPVDVEIMESYTVSPTLGAESLKASMVAGGTGLALVLFYMMAYYRMFGVVANCALAVYAVVVLASMNIPSMQFVLTLPGIAGFILSIGMAVDANVLVFERIREELTRGRSLREAFDHGFERSFASIIDSHLTTLLGAAILFVFGSASIKGFGLTLMLGTVWSIFTATYVTKQFLNFAFYTLGIKNQKVYGG